MCFEGNSAPLSSTYLNSQLTSFWKNAVDCAHDDHVGVNSPEYHKSKYTRALAEFYYIGENTTKYPLKPDDLRFHASFGKPELKFVCNHEVILSLTIKSGHMRVDHNGKANGAAHKVDSINKPLPNIHVAFRVPFVRTNVKGHDSKIGNETSWHLIQMIVLQFGDAKIVKFNADKTWDIDFTESLAFYLHAYLAFLTLAGNHVLFDLPDFAAEDKESWTDYALLRSRIEPDVYCQDVTLFGINTKVINNFLKTQWANARDLDQGANDYLAASIARISTNWLTNALADNNFYVRFGAPHIKPLCPHEVVLFFEINDVAFFDSNDFEKSEPLAVHHGWTVAFVVNVIDFDSSIGVLMLDFKSARYASAFSSTNLDVSVVEYFNLLVKFLTADYLDILLLYNYNIIYRLIVDKVAVLGEDSGSWKRAEYVGQVQTSRRHGQSLVWVERIRAISLSDADQVLALTEDSINRIFFSRWRALGSSHLLTTWSKDAFKANFSSLTIRLLSNGKVVVYVDIVRGEIGSTVVKTEQTTVVNGRHDAFWLVGWNSPAVTNDVTKSYAFDKITLAFEAELQLAASGDLDVEEHITKELHSSIAHHLKTTQHLVVKHLVLNLKNAKYIPALSNVHGLGSLQESQKRLEILKSRIGDYLFELSRGGHSVIKTVPTFVHDHTDPLGFSDISFKVLTKEEISVDTYAASELRTTVSDTPIVVIFGVCSNRKLPAFTSKWSLGWLPSGAAKNAVGTVWFSRESFLESRLLHALESFNARTTVVPTFAGVVDGQWKCDITTWDKHEPYGARGQVCHWHKAGNSSPRSLEYVWEHYDNWSNREGDSLSEGEYSIACQTNNHLSIPTDYTPGHQLEIQVKGQSTIRISGHTHRQRWSKKTVASWNATVTISSRHDGLHVSMTPHVSPVVEEGGYNTENVYFPFNVQALHRDRFPDNQTALQDLLPRLKGALEGPWAHSTFSMHKFSFANPVFTRNGDFVLEIYPYDHAAAVPHVHQVGPASVLSTVTNAPAPVVTANDNAAKIAPKASNGALAIAASKVVQSTPVILRPTAEFMHGSYDQEHGDS